MMHTRTIDVAGGIPVEPQYDTGREDRRGMRVAVFSLGPLFPNHVHGGSQKTLTSIARRLARDGCDVSVFCTRRDDNQTSFPLDRGVVVHPMLRFKQTYPEPYYAAPYELAEVVELLGGAARTHDRFYVHDGELLYHFIYDEIPTVISFQDFVYPDTLAGTLSFRRDHLVLSSSYARACVEQVFRRFRILPGDWVSVAPNGFDLHELRPRDSTAIRAELGLSPDALVILYPHRPDPRKGIWECLRVVLRALDQLQEGVAKRVRLVAPIWVDSNVNHGSNHVYQGIYEDAKRAVDEAGRPDLLHLHPWLPVDRMAEYYSLGSATLCIGSFVEAFGNVSVESQLCGTPAIVSRVGAQRSVLPESVITKTDYGDEKRAADVLVAALKGERLFPFEESRRLVGRCYGHEAMVAGYADAIYQARRLPSLPSLELVAERTDAVEIPAWCALLDSGYYNDYAYGYADDPRLQDVAARLLNGPVSIAEIGDLASPADIKSWIASGHLVSVRSRT